MVVRKSSFSSCDGDVAEIPRFYSGKSVLITGATGFMGKVLIERLLSTCPDVGTLYLLIRMKKEVPPESRLLELKQSPVFDVIRERCPWQLEKLTLVPGDVSIPGLGLGQETVDEMKEVSIVFHNAATVRFDEELRKAVDMNTRSVISIMDLCDRLPKIEAFIHVSTAYSNAELDVVEEKIYPPPQDLGQLLALTECLPTNQLNQITPKYIEPKPNTYTFTKAMAESAVQRHGCTKYPIAIFRPSIVISSMKHPFPGWIENLNGPSSVIVAAGKGLMHVFQCKTDAKADLIPVDIAIDTLIAVAWEVVSDQPKDVRVYHCCTSENPTTWQQFVSSLRRDLLQHPFDNVFWYPCGSSFESTIMSRATELLTQTIPLHLAEYVTKMLGIKTPVSLITVSQKMRTMGEMLTFFTLREWHFQTDRVQKLRQRLSKADAEIYNLDPNTINWPQQYSDFVKGTRKYLLKEKDLDIDKARKHLLKMKIIHQGLKVFALVVICRALLHYKITRTFIYGILSLFLSLSNKVFRNITSRGTANETQISI